MRSLRSGLVVGALVALARPPVCVRLHGHELPRREGLRQPEMRDHVIVVQGNSAGSVINYSVNPDGSLTSVISAAHGTATGRCVLASLPGSCVFSSGTGSLTQFHLDVAVTTTDGVTWFWDGSYWFGNGG